MLCPNLCRYLMQDLPNSLALNSVFWVHSVIHYTMQYICVCVYMQDAKYKRTRRSLLHEEYVEGQKGGGVGQPDAGFKVSPISLAVYGETHRPVKWGCVHLWFDCCSN